MSGAALPLGWGATAHPFWGGLPQLCRGLDWSGYSSVHDGRDLRQQRYWRAPCCAQDEQDDHADQSKCSP
jgi:hypothetical protein